MHAPISNMVFLLKSHVISRKAKAMHEIKASCYENLNVTVEIRSPFLEDGVFSISIIAQQLIGPVVFQSASNGVKGGKGSQKALNKKTLGQKKAGGGKNSAEGGYPTAEKLQPSNEEEKGVIPLIAEPLFTTQGKEYVYTYKDALL